MYHFQLLRKACYVNIVPYLSVSNVYNQKKKYIFFLLTQYYIYYIYIYILFTVMNAKCIYLNINSCGDEYVSTILLLSFPQKNKNND